MGDTIFKPVLKFKDEKQLEQYLKYWQHILHLDHWCIKAGFADEIVDKGNNPLEGMNEVIFDNCEAYITISREERKSHMKHCEEHTLVHELLHCLLPIIDYTDPSVEEVAYANAMHQHVEMLAKSFIMTCYDVDIDWFMEGGADD